MSTPGDRRQRSEEERERARIEREARRSGRPQPAPGAASGNGSDASRAPRFRHRREDPGTQREEPPPYSVHRAGGGRPAADSARRILAARREQLARGRDGGEPAKVGAANRRRRLLPLLLALAAGSLVGLWFLLSLFQPFKGDGEGELRVAIPEGSSIGQIGDLLDERGVVSSGFFFATRARLAGDASELKSGKYTLRRGMSYAAALDVLSAGPPPPKTLNITILEGPSREEVAPTVEDAGVEGDYLKATKSSKALDPADYGADGAENLEGFLFPATYELKAGAAVDDLVTQQLDAFKDQFADVDLKAAKRANLSPYEVLVIASMVEREAQLSKERPIIASVIYNRLKDGMPLGIDATTRFATGNWTEPLTESELALDSPYNTRENAGLPPGPIGNPGLDSIEAAANPDDTDFLFYVVKPGTCGEHAFSETDAEFQQNVERYNSERAARGGQSPTDCPS